MAGNPHLAAVIAASAVAAVVAAVAVVLVSRILKDPGSSGSPSSAASPSSSGSSGSPTTPAPEAKKDAAATVGVAGTETPSPVSGVKTVLLDTVPLWYRNSLLYGDPYNRDPVCYGDPYCQAAYFRDWPYGSRYYGRRDSYRRDRPHSRTPATTQTNQQTQNVNVTVPPAPSAGGIAGTTPPMSTAQGPAGPVKVLSSTAADPEPLHDQVREVVLHSTGEPQIPRQMGAAEALPTAAAVPETAMITEVAGTTATTTTTTTGTETPEQAAGAAKGARSKASPCSSPLSCGGNGPKAQRRSAFSQHQYAATPY
jgi:hypothetical protein